MRLFALFLLLLTASLAAIACGGGGAAGRRGVQREEATSSATCGGCHRTESAEWEASLHRSSFTDRDFQTSFANEPDPFCFGCHAPLARDRADVAGAALGVGCPSCHVVAEVHGTMTRASGTASSHAQTKGCASCHEFTFPDRAALMQSTVTEHARSPFAKTDCVSCHLPRSADGHRDHRFNVSRNEALLRAALRVKSRRTSDGIEVTLTTRNVGHAMPTGDLFRRLVVHVVGEDATGTFVGEGDLVLGRRFDRGHGIAVETVDTRVEGERQMTVTGEWLRRAVRVRVEVAYERVAQAAELEDVRGARTDRDTVFSRVLLYRGSPE